MGLDCGESRGGGGCGCVHVGGCLCVYIDGSCLLLCMCVCWLPARPACVPACLASPPPPPHTHSHLAVAKLHDLQACASRQQAWQAGGYEATQRGLIQAVVWGGGGDVGGRVK